MSIRLTNQRRYEIEELLVTRAFGERKQQLKNNADLLANALIDLRLGVHKKALESLPERWLTPLSYIRVRSWREELQMHYVRFLPRTWQNQPMAVGPDSANDGDEVKLAPEQAAMFDLHFAEAEQLEKDEVQFRRDVSGVLKSVGTVKKLYETWPELAEVYTVKETNGGASTALVKDVAHLNEVLGLPSDKTKKA